jgi:glutamine synthetase
MGAIESGLQLENLVSTVLASPRVGPPPATLAEARNAPGRDARIAEIQCRIEAEGIQYVFFQQVSVSGHVNGKGVVSDFFAQVAKNGYQLVYGATADLFLDRHDNYIGFGRTPPSSRRSPTSTPSPSCRGTRAWPASTATATTPRPGGLLESDPRQNLKVVADQVESELSDLLGTEVSFLCGIEPEMMWFGRKPSGGEEPVGLTKPWCYHINQFEQLRDVILDVVAYGKALGLRMSYGDHEDSPGQLELNFAFDRALRTADNLTTYRQICAAVGRKHDLFPSFMPKPFTGVSANGAHHHFTLGRRVGEERLLRPERSGHAVRGGAVVPGRHPQALPRADVRLGADRELVQALLRRGLLGADPRRLRLAEPHLRRARGGLRPLRVPLGRLGVQPY